MECRHGVLAQPRQLRKWVLKGKMVPLPKISHIVRFKYLSSTLDITCLVGIEDKFVTGTDSSYSHKAARDKASRGSPRVLAILGRVIVLVDPPATTRYIPSSVGTVILCNRVIGPTLA